MTLPFRLPAPRPVTVPRSERFTLANGITVHVVERRALPIVEVLVVLRAGAETDPAHLAGRAWITGELFAEGTKRRDGRAFGDAVDTLGATFHTRAGWDDAALSLHVLRPRLEPALELLAEALTEPAFEEAAFAQKQRERLASLLQEKSEPRALAGNAFARTAYPAGHPYARPLAGTEASIGALTAADAAAHYREWCSTASACVVVVGDTSVAELAPVLERTIGSWRTALAAAPPAIPAVPLQDGPRVVLVERAGAPQAELRVGHPGTPRRTPAYFPLAVLNTVVGGAFTSRINMRLREEKGYTYGARSGFSHRHGPGPFVVSTAVEAAATADSVSEILKELVRIREEPVGEVELERARRYLTLGMARAFEGTSGVAEHIAEQVVYGLGDDYYEHFAERIRAVDAVAVQAAARAHVHPAHATIVVVADGAVAAELGEVTQSPVTRVSE